MRISYWCSDVCSSELGRQDRRGHYHYRDRPDPRVRRDGVRIPAPHSDHLRFVDRLRGQLLFPVLLLLRRRGTDFMMGDIEGFEAPMHRALAEPILLGGAPRAIAIVNGTVAAALGLGLQQWIAGIVLWAAGHTLAVFAAKRDPDFAPVLVRHLRQRGYLTC